VGELPEREDDDRRRAPLFERFGVPDVDEVDEVAFERVRRVPVCCCGGYCEGYCADCIVLLGGVYVTGDGAVGKTPEEVVRVRE
jgi:hypothetical protein